MFYHFYYFAKLLRVIGLTKTVSTAVELRNCEFRGLDSPPEDTASLKKSETYG